MHVHPTFFDLATPLRATHDCLVMNGLLYSGSWVIVETNAEIVGGELRTLEEETLANCQSACVDDTACIGIRWFAHSDNGSRCWTHDMDDATAVPTANNGSTVYQLNRPVLSWYSSSLFKVYYTTRKTSPQSNLRRVRRKGPIGSDDSQVEDRPLPGKPSLRYTLSTRITNYSDSTALVF